MASTVVAISTQWFLSRPILAMIVATVAASE